MIEGYEWNPRDKGFLRRRKLKALFPDVIR